MGARFAAAMGLLLSAPLWGCGRTDLLGDIDAGIDAVVVEEAPGCGVEDVPTACVGRQCQSRIDNCACRKLPPTTIRGFVYDPAGNLPLYGAYVYVPSTAPDPIVPGNPTCSRCPAPASGTPIQGALTDVHGAFELAAKPGDAWGVPSGDDVPLVIQIGKWRRIVTIPHVEACSDNTLPDPSTPADKLRLPARTSEGDMPLIAFTSGCDPAECFLRDLGIDDSEFVPPGSATGHVHFFTGKDESSGLGGGSAIMGGNLPGETYTWWQNIDDLRKYDVVFNACECKAFDRGASAYAAMHDYLAGGGRVFAGHFFYNWFAPPEGPLDLQGVANWHLPETEVDQPYASFFVDTTFPRGAAYADWLDLNKLSNTHGQLALSDTRYADDGTPPGSTRWIYNAALPNDAMYATMYSSFEVPYGVPLAEQCGRAAMCEMHITGTTDDSTFPRECVSSDPTRTAKEQALEFLFFDLLGCVQDPHAPPALPDTN